MATTTALPLVTVSSRPSRHQSNGSAYAHSERESLFFQFGDDNVQALQQTEILFKDSPNDPTAPRCQAAVLYQKI